MLGADPDWIRETQRQVLEAEEWKLDKVAERVQRLAEDFPVDAGMAALTTMRDELNTSREGIATTKGLADRMIDVSGGLSPTVGNWVKAMAGRKNKPTSWLLQVARWFTEPARFSLWHRVVKNADLAPAKRPLIFQRWLPMALVGAGVLLLVVAGVVDVAAIRIIAAMLAGLVLTVGAALFVMSWYVRRMRRRIRGWIEKRMPPISPS